MVPHVAVRGAGYVMAKEIDVLSRLLGDVDRPYLAIVGGAKVSDKIEVLDALLARVDVIAIGGAMANTFLTAQGKQLGKSKVEADKLSIARNFLRKAARSARP
jgi:phosphoglycerate kinase